MMTMGLIAPIARFAWGDRHYRGAPLTPIVALTVKIAALVLMGMVCAEHVRQNRRRWHALSLEEGDVEQRAPSYAEVVDV